MMKFWIYENHTCELRSEELNEGWSSHFKTALSSFHATAKVAYITAMIILHLKIQLVGQKIETKQLKLEKRDSATTVLIFEASAFRY